MFGLHNSIAFTAKQPLNLVFKKLTQTKLGELFEIGTAFSTKIFKMITNTPTATFGTTFFISGQVVVAGQH